MNHDIIIHKLNHESEETLRYPGRVLARDQRSVILEAFFSREPMELGYVTLKPGDRFVEYFYSEGWYSNITRPADIAENHVRAEDLALDYFVQPAGREFILDEDEFITLPLPP